MKTFTDRIVESLVFGLILSAIMMVGLGIVYGLLSILIRAILSGRVFQFIITVGAVVFVLGVAGYQIDY